MPTVPTSPGEHRFPAEDRLTEALTAISNRVAELNEIAKRAEAAPLPSKEIDLSSIYARTEAAHG